MDRRDCAAMIVCSCNVLTDHDVRSTLSGEEAARTAGEVYGCLGCSPQCGRCARTIRRIMDEALATADTPRCRAKGVLFQPFHLLKPDGNPPAAGPLRIRRKVYNGYNQRARTSAR